MLKVSIIVAASSLAAALPVRAQTTVHVDDGEQLTGVELSAGAFNGQPFTLSPDTTFEINSGGAMSVPGDIFADASFFLGDATVNINDGGVFSGGFVGRATINVGSGGSFASAQVTGSTINVNGGTVGSVFSTVEFNARGDVDINVNAGRVNFVDTWDGGERITISGGSIGTIRQQFDSIFFGSSQEVFVNGGTIELLENSSSVVTQTAGRVDRARFSPLNDTTSGIFYTMQGGSAGSLSVNSLFMSGGNIDDGAGVVGGFADVSGGTIGGRLSIFGSTFDGQPDGTFDAASGRITGGTIEGGVSFRGPRPFDFLDGLIPTLEISGGQITGGFSVEGRTETTLVVRTALLDGQTLDLAVGETVEVIRGDANLLDVILEDGNAFRLTASELEQFGPSIGFSGDSRLFIRGGIPTPGAFAALALAGLAGARRRR